MSGKQMKRFKMTTVKNNVTVKTVLNKAKNKIPIKKITMKNLIFPILTLSMFATTSVHSKETPYYTALTPQGKVRNHRYSIKHSKNLSNFFNELLLD